MRIDVPWSDYWELHKEGKRKWERLAKEARETYPGLELRLGYIGNIGRDVHGHFDDTHWRVWCKSEPVRRWYIIRHHDGGVLTRFVGFNPYWHREMEFVLGKIDKLAEADVVTFHSWLDKMAHRLWMMKGE
jgi:hypothetical protein